MPKVSVWVNDELMATVKEQLPGVVVSAVLADGLRALLECDHRSVVCAACAAPVDARTDLVNPKLDAFYGDVLWDLQPLVHRGGTAEGAARIVKDVASRHQVPAANRIPLPRPSRSQREANQVKDLPHPTDERTAA